MSFKIGDNVVFLNMNIDGHFKDDGKIVDYIPDKNLFLISYYYLNGFRSNWVDGRYIEKKTI